MNEKYIGKRRGRHTSMGHITDGPKVCNGFEVMARCINGLARRKQVDSVHARSNGGHGLAKALTVPYLVAIGVGATIGAGVYILVGTVAREHSGPSLAISFLIAGIAAALSALCYAELCSRCPSAGSAYHYSYICAGEGVAWMIGWALILEYTIGGSAVARGISPNLALFFGGDGNLPVFLARQHLPWMNIVVDPCAAFLVFVVMALLCVGIKESSTAQGIVTAVNVCAMIFIIIAGSYLGFRNKWPGYDLPTGYFPYGVNGMLAGSATVFFAFIGFDSVASTAEEVKNPQRDLPLGIGLSLFICCSLYMLVSIVIVGLVPYFQMDPDTPISSAFASNGMQWSAYVIAAGAVMALVATLMGSLLPQPRILMAMARDGLLPSFFCDVNHKTQVPVKATVATGVIAALLAFFLNVEQLAGMVSVGTLLAFTMVAVSVLILRYVPPDVVPFPSSLRDTIDSVSTSFIGRVEEGDGSASPLLGEDRSAGKFGYILKEDAKGKLAPNEKKRRKIAGWTIASIFFGAFILAFAASNVDFFWVLRFSSCGIGAVFLLLGVVILTCIEQDEARHKFGYAGGFHCPFVPVLPISCILINMYLLVNLGSDTWMRVSVWLALGALVYVSYGRTHSSLIDAVYVPAEHANEIHLRSEAAA